MKIPVILEAVYMSFHFGAKNEMFLQCHSFKLPEMNS